MPKKDIVVPPPAGFLTEWCIAHSDGSEHRPEAFLGPGIALMSTVLAPVLHAKWSPTYSEPGNVWIAMAARSALGGKTTTAAALKWGIKRAERSLGDNIRSLSLDRFSDADLVMELDVVGQDTEKARNAEKDRAKKAGEDPQHVEEVERPVPVGHVLTLNELAQLWGGNIPKHHEQARVTMLSLYDGHLSSNTRTTKVVSQQCCVTLLGNIPLSELADRTDIGTIRSGFAGRFVVLELPDPIRHIASPRGFPDGAMDALETQVNALCELARPSYGHASVRTHNMIDMLPPGSKADKMRNKWYEDSRKRIAASTSTDELEQAKDEMFQRAQATALKLAAYTAITDAQRNTEKQRTPLRLDDVEIDVKDIGFGIAVADHSIGALTNNVSASLGITSEKILRRLKKLGAVDQQTAVRAPDLRRSIKGLDSVAFQRECAALARGEEIMLEKVKDPHQPGPVPTLIWLA